MTERSTPKARSARYQHKKPEPTAGSIDTQSVKTIEKGELGTYGFDVGKKVKGRKPHVRVDTLGLVLKAVVHKCEYPGRRWCQAGSGGYTTPASLTEESLG
jgi:hypothetical protein